MRRWPGRGGVAARVQVQVWPQCPYLVASPTGCNVWSKCTWEPPSFRGRTYRHHLREVADAEDPLLELRQRRRGDVESEVVGVGLAPRLRIVAGWEPRRIRAIVDVGKGREGSALGLLERPARKPLPRAQRE